MQQLSEKCQTLKKLYQSKKPSGFIEQATNAFALKLLNEFPEDPQQLSAYLQDNWTLVKGSLFSPTAIPNEFITDFLCDIATFLDPKNPIAQLMPGVIVDATHPNFPNLRAFNDDDIDELRHQFLKPSTVFGNLGLKSAGVQLKMDALDERRTIFFDKLTKEKVLSRQSFEMLRLMIKDSLQIARQVAEEDENAYTIMPEIDKKRREFKERLENIKKRFVSQTKNLKNIIKTHILSDDGETLIPISILTSEPFSDFNPYSEDFKKITDSELARIYQHSELTREIQSVEKNIEDFTSQSHDLYSKLKKLCLMLKINDAHGGKGSQEQVGEGAFIALVEFQAYFNLLTKNQKKLIPSPVMQAIEKLLDVSSNMRGSSMVGNIETCAGSRREQIEQAMLGQTQQLMQITLNDDTKQGALLEEQKKLDYLKQQLKSNLELKKYTGADTLGFNPSLLQKIALSYSVKTIDDLNELKKLSTKDLHEVLKGNPQLNQQILAIIKTIDDLVIFSSGVTPENLQLLLSFFGPEFKKIIVDPLVFFELVLHHQDLKKLFLLSWYFDVGGKILNTGNPLVSKLIGDLRKIKKIYPSEITDNPENLAIIFAALTGDEEKIRLALEKDLSLLCLTWLVAKNNQYQKIANQLYEEILKRPNGVNKALQMAMVEGDEDAVEKLLLDERIGVWQHNTNGQTPLHLAALNGFKLTHKLWERMKIDVHAQDVFGNTALMYAIKKKNIEMAHLILQTNLNVNLKNQAQFSALSLAAQSGQEELVIELLKHPNIIDSQEIALELAVIHGHAAIVRRLLNRFSTKTKTLNLDSFCQKAIQNDHIHVFSELIKHMEPAQQKQQIKKNIELAMSKKFYGYVVILLDMSSVVRIQMGQDILHEAVRLNEPELVKALLKRDIPATELALTEAIQNDNTDIICLLLENLAIEADHPLLDTLYQKYQFKALEILLQAGRQDLMEKFLQKDTIDLHQIDEKGETVLFQLAKNKDASFRKIFKRLCETNKVDVNVFNRMFKDLMERRDFKAIKFLLTIKKDERYLIEINDEVVKFLSDNDMQKSALMFAANIGRVDLFQKILANNTTLTAEEISDIAKLTEEDVFSVMLEHIDVNGTMLPGLYPGNLLHALIRLAYIKAKSQDIYLAKAYEIILKTNIDLNVRNGFGQTAFDLIPEGQKSIFFDNLFKQMIASSKHKKLLEALLPGWDQLAWKSSNQEIIELYLKLAQIPQLIDNKQDVTEAQVAQQISDYLKNTITGFLIMSMFWNAAEFLGLIDKTDKPLVYQMLDTLEEKQAENPSPR